MTARPGMVPADDPRIALIVDLVASYYGYRLPFKHAAPATQHARTLMARELLTRLDAAAAGAQ